MLGLLLIVAANSAALADRGTCVGLAWVALVDGETTRVQEGPDYDVHRFTDAGGHTWAVYDGNHAPASADGPDLLKRDGVIVRRAQIDGKFQGYIVEQNGRQNHFFGAVFDGTEKDKAFFERVDFGPRGRLRCRLEAQSR